MKLNFILTVQQLCLTFILNIYLKLLCGFLFVQSYVYKIRVLFLLNPCIFFYFSCCTVLSRISSKLLKMG